MFRTRSDISASGRYGSGLLCTSDGYRDGYRDRCRDGYRDGCEDRCRERYRDGCGDGYRDGCRDGQRDGWQRRIRRRFAETGKVTRTEAWKAAGKETGTCRQADGLDGAAES